MKSFFKYITWILFIIMLIIMFLFSNMSSGDSNSRSKKIIRSGVVIVDKVFNLNMDDKDINKTVIKLNYPFRKLCHFCEYFLLSLLLILALRLSNLSIKTSIIITMSFCIIYSISDEVHQIFVSGRSPLIIDCIIDTLGCFCLCLIYYIRTKKIS